MLNGILRRLGPIFLMMLALGTNTGAWETLDVKAWLGKPGVKLLAVEFYATWCGPCMKAVPKWKALHEEFRDKGLRLVVVSVRDQGSCSSPDWNPDSIVCDEDGVIQDQWKAGKLPQAFLFSWQGNQLVANGTVEQVETAVRSYFKELPRILVDEPQDEAGKPLPNGGELKKMVRAELRRASKFDLVADEKERAEIQRLRKEGYKAKYDDAGHCELGKDVSPNSQLKVSYKKRGEGGKGMLRLELFSLERGCLDASAKAPVSGQDFEPAVAEAVASLIQGMIGDISYKATPKPKPAVVKPSGPGVQGADYEEEGGPAGPVERKRKVTEASAALSIKATPAEAVITVTGPKKFKDSGEGKWSREDLKPGKYTVKVEAAGYESQEKEYTLESDDNKADKITLLRLGVLEVVGTPEKAKVEIEGPNGFAVTKGLPVTITDAARGTYRLKVSKKGYEGEEYTAEVVAGSTATVQVNLKKPGNLEISGSPEGSKVEVVGPNGFKGEGGLPYALEGAYRGEYQIKVSREGYGTVEKRATVKPGETARVEVKLQKGASAGEVTKGDDGIEWVSIPGRVL